MGQHLYYRFKTKNWFRLQKQSDEKTTQESESDEDATVEGFLQFWATLCVNRTNLGGWINFDNYFWPGNYACTNYLFCVDDQEIRRHKILEWNLWLYYVWPTVHIVSYLSCCPKDAEMENRLNLTLFWQKWVQVLLFICSRFSWEMKNDKVDFLKSRSVIWYATCFFLRVALSLS